MFLLAIGVSALYLQRKYNLHSVESIKSPAESWINENLLSPLVKQWPALAPIQAKLTSETSPDAYDETFWSEELKPLVRVKHPYFVVVFAPGFAPPGIRAGVPVTYDDLVEAEAALQNKKAPRP